MSSALLKAVEINPPGTASAVIIWLHGLGADGHDFEPLIPELHIVREHGVRVVLPHAPSRPVTINGGMVMPAWYDITGLDFRSREDAAGIEQSRRQLEQLIDHELATGIPPRQVFLAGFSQGGAVVLHTGLRHAQRLGGLIVLSAYLPLPASLAAGASAANADVPVFMAHGVADPVVPYALGAASRALLEQAGYPVDWFSYPMQHAVCMEEIADLRAWLLVRLSAAGGDLNAQEQRPGG